MSSATKAKLATLYIMAQEAVYIRIVLEEMGHTQLRNGQRSCQWKGATKTNKGNGYALPLAAGSGMPEAIPYILETW